MSFLFALAAILSLSLFFNRRFSLSSAAAPMLSIAAITVFLCLAGMLDLLVAGTLLVFAAAAFSLVYVFIIKRYPLKELISGFFTPGLVFFIVGSFFFFRLLTVKNAIFRDWDEFSFWGVAAKLVFLNNRLYTFFPASITLSSQPALPVFSYFIQFFNRSFIERHTYVAYDMMITASLSVMFSRLKWKNVFAVLSLSAFSFLGIYAFFHASEGLRAYATSYSDMQMGFLFGGTVLMWFHSDDKGFSRYFSTLAMLSLLVYCKDVALSLALIAAAIMTVDTLLSANYPCDALAEKSDAAKKLAAPGVLALIAIPVLLLLNRQAGFILLAVSAASAAGLLIVKSISFDERAIKISKALLRVFFVLLPFILIIFLYRLWAMHYAATQTASRDPVLRASIVEILLGRNDYFNMVFTEMKRRFFNHSLICFGTIFEMFIVFTVVPVAASFLAKTKRKMLRLSSLSIMMSLGFLAYYLLHAILYVVIFINNLDFGLPFDLVSFNRYISTYAIGWMFVTIGILFLDVSEPFFKTRLLSFAPAAAAALSIVAAIFYFTPDHPDQYLITSEKVIISQSGPRSATIRHIGKLKSALTPDDLIYFISFSLDGGEWFYFGYDCYPALTPKEIGWFVDPETDDESLRNPETGEFAMRYIGMDKKGFSTFLRDNGITFVYVNYRIDDYFLQEFSPLFEDSLALTYDDSARLYFVGDGEGDLVNLIPVYSADGIRALREGE